MTVRVGMTMPFLRGMAATFVFPYSLDQLFGAGFKTRPAPECREFQPPVALFGKFEKKFDRLRFC